ncbi:uncharacterized protein LOC120009863 isoform X1 [Tripterygium wilfordii]|uniref:uncharacterized protein LOC120009863 isoform X1 n=1 Tax=Tripterygium wilfordii TaxID=458696 RepID=UPI0018F7EFBF|nr:uncharacterized protein LOC120009863 isoform X1 [Tripterygium wilfordii]
MIALEIHISSPHQSTSGSLKTFAMRPGWVICTSSLWKNLGIHEFLLVIEHKVHVDKALLCTAIHLWDVVTSSFHFRIGFMSSTLQDLAFILAMQLDSPEANNAMEAPKEEDKRTKLASRLKKLKAKMESSLDGKTNEKKIINNLKSQIIDLQTEVRILEKSLAGILYNNTATLRDFENVYAKVLERDDKVPVLTDERAYIEVTTTASIVSWNKLKKICDELTIPSEELVPLLHICQ